jgi:hypothetical protein
MGFKCNKTEVYNALKQKDKIMNEGLQGNGQMDFARCHHMNINGWKIENMAVGIHCADSSYHWGKKAVKLRTTQSKITQK